MFFSHLFEFGKVKFGRVKSCLAKLRPYFYIMLTLNFSIFVIGIQLRHILVFLFS